MGHCFMVTCYLPYSMGSREVASRSDFIARYGWSCRRCCSSINEQHDIEVFLWLSVTSNIPERSPQIFASELKYIPYKATKDSPTHATSMAIAIPPFKQLLSKLPTWLFIVANLCIAGGSLLYFHGCPCILTVYHVDLRQAAWFRAAPWTMMALVGYFLGACSDILIPAWIRGKKFSIMNKSLANE